MDEHYLVSARKYRPSTFSTVVGQKALTATLRNAIATDRLAHAYLFCGSRGVGKTSCARIFAKTINCEHPTPEGDPCNECESCRAFNENRSLNIVELDAASNNGVDDIRALVEQVQVPPTNGRYRVFIIDEVHMLSPAAFNAFLKTLEEPPSYVVFILATTEKHKIIPTILSRCQIYDFARITVSDMIDHLEHVASLEGIATERSALSVIAQKADGAMRDALSIFDQVAASSRGNITYASAIANLNVLDTAYYGRLMEAFIAGDVPGALLIYKEVRDRGFDSHFFITGLAAYLRDLMVARDQRTLSLLDTDESIRTQMAQEAAKVPVDFFYKAMSLCNDADLNYRQASSKTFIVELLLVRLCQQLSPSPASDPRSEGLKPFKESDINASQHAAPVPGPAIQTAPQAATQPAPQPAAAPVVAPAAAGNFAPPPPPPGSSRGLKSTRPAKQRRPETDKTPADASRGSRSASYTPEQLAAAWDAYAAAHPKEHLMANTMQSARPMPGSEPHCYKVAVPTEIQVNTLNEHKPELLRHLRDSLGNDAIDFLVTIDESGTAPRFYNDRELLQLAAQNPELHKMITELELKIL